MTKLTGKKLHVPFRVFESAMMAAAKDDIRYYLNGIHIKCGRVESTNGHVAYIADIRNTDKPDFLPETTTAKESVTIRPKNKVPRWTRKNQLDHVIITVNDKDASIDYYSFYGERVASDVAIVVDGKFPNIPKLVADVRKNKIDSSAKVGVRVEYLDLPNKMLSHCKLHAVKMELFGSDKAMVFTLNRITLQKVKETLVIMPARLS